MIHEAAKVKVETDPVTILRHELSSLSWRIARDCYDADKDPLTVANEAEIALTRMKNACSSRR